MHVCETLCTLGRPLRKFKTIPSRLKRACPGIHIKRGHLRGKSLRNRKRSIWSRRGNAVLHHCKRPQTHRAGCNHKVDKSMINLIEGQIDLNEKNISVTSDYNYLNILSNIHSIEKRKDPSGGEPYFYIETIDGNMRFGVTVSMAEKKLNGYCCVGWMARVPAKDGMTRAKRI